MASAGTSYQQLLDAVESYYGSGSDQWVEVAKYGLRADNMAEILRQVPGVQAHVNKSGSVIGYTISESVALNDGGTSLPAVNSNVQTGTAAPTNTTEIQTLGNFTSDPVTGDVSSTNQIPKKTGGTVGTAAATIGKVASTVMAAGFGLSLGRFVNNQIYENNPDFWYNLTDTPEGSEARAEWERITAAYDEVDKDGKVTHFLNVIAGLDGKEAKVYADENAMAYYAWKLKESGFFDSGESYITPSAGSYSFVSGLTLDQSLSNIYPVWANSSNNPFTRFGLTYADLYTYASTRLADFGVSDVTHVFAVSANQTTCAIRWISKSSIWTAEAPQVNGNGVSVQRFIHPNSGSYYSGYLLISSSNTGFYQNTASTDYKSDFYVASGLYSTTSNPYYFNSASSYMSFNTSLSGIILNGSLTQVTPGLPGVSEDPNATQPNTTGWDAPADTLASLKNQYPELWDDAYENTVIDEDGNETTVIYIPVPLPANYNNGNPITEDNPSTQQNPAVDPDNPSVTDDLLRTIIAILSKPATDPATITDPKTDDPTNNVPNPPDTGGGTTPPIVVPVGSASALWAAYNPTQAEINSLGAWLWSNNFVDQLLKMFNDPMQAIIGLHKTFIPPITGAAQDIKVGYLNSGVSSLTVPTQYSSVNCGTINCAEYFGNVFDYAPYTKVYLYLPFIGFKELDVAQVMRSTINVIYHGDAYTGCCLAEVSVVRDGEAGGVLYTYSGDCAARYPLSHGSYMGIVNALAGIGIGIGTALAGAPSIGIAGAVGMAQHARATVEHSGSFSGNSGAMGIKKPYLVIMRPQTAMASNYEHFTGQPSNSNVVLGSASGYVRVKECHVEDIATATDAEKQMIESALKTGVII